MTFHVPREIAADPVPPAPTSRVICAGPLVLGPSHYCQHHSFCCFFMLKDKRLALGFRAGFPSLPPLLTSGTGWFPEQWRVDPSPWSLPSRSGGHPLLPSRGNQNTPRHRQTSPEGQNHRRGTTALETKILGWCPNSSFPHDCRWISSSLCVSLSSPAK